MKANKNFLFTYWKNIYDKEFLAIIIFLKIGKKNIENYHNWIYI